MSAIYGRKAVAVIACLDARIVIYYVERNPIWQPKAAARLAALVALQVTQLERQSVGRLDRVRSMASATNTGTDPATIPMASRPRLTADGSPLRAA